MRDPLGDMGNIKPSADLGDSKVKKYAKLILALASLLGILSAVLIFATLFNVEFPLKEILTIEKLGIIAGVCAFICGIYTIIGLIKGRKEF